MMNEAFMHVRAALGAIDNGTVTNPNTTGLPNLSTGAWGGVEIQNLIKEMVGDACSRDTEFRQLVKRVPMQPGTIAVTWLLAEDSGSTSKAAFYSDGGAGAPYPSTRKQLNTVAKALRSDYEVSGLMIAGGFFDVLAQEAQDALTSMALAEEKAFINGNDASDGMTGSYVGLHQLMLQGTAHGDTTATYGLTKGTDACLETQATDGGVSGSATGTLDLADLDDIKTKCEKRKLTGRRIWLMSFERADQLTQLLQPQVRYAGSYEIAGGNRVPTYHTYPIVRSKRMSYVGVTNTGGASNDASSDNCILLLDLDTVEFRTVAGVDTVHIPIMGGGDATNYLQRGDVRGGYFKTYGVFVMKRFDNQGILWNLTAP